MSERWLLPPLWFEACWSIAGLDEYPFPLSVASHGETTEERSVLFQRAEPDMRAAGLLDGNGLTSRFGFALARIAKPGLWIEGLWNSSDSDGENTYSRLLAVAFEEGTILAAQAPGTTHGGDVEISFHRDPPGTAALRGMPPTPPGDKHRVAVPTSALKPASDDEELDPMGSRLPPKLRQSVREIRELLDSAHARDGQFTANHRDTMGRHQRSSVLKWFDTESGGRYGVTLRPSGGTEHELAVAPLGPEEISRSLESRVGEVRSG